MSNFQAHKKRRLTPKIITLLSLVVFLGLTSAQFGQAKRPWEPIIAKNGIRVFKREDPNSNMFEFKGEGVVDAHVAKIISLLQDISLTTEWVEDCKKAELLDKNYTETDVKKNINDFSLTMYAVNAAPWPISDRDYILKGKIRYDSRKDLAILDLSDVRHPRKPPQSGLVRMKFMKVRLTLKPLKDDTKTWVQLYVHLDPAGLIPAWAVNFVTKKVPYNSLLKLRKLSKRTSYDKGIETLVLNHMERIRKKK